MADVFRALADPSRRLLLDTLFERDGQTLSELEEKLPQMTRFGVMKHLRLLEETNLITTRRSGREKLHYLNPVPIQLIHARWTSKYSVPFLRGITALKAELEDSTLSDPRHVYNAYIRTSPEKLWEAITSGEMTRRYFFDTSVKADLSPGGRIEYANPDGSLAVKGEVLEADPPRRLVHTWMSLYGPDVAGEPASRVTWEINQMGPACQLVVVHDNLESSPKTAASVTSPMGWELVLSGMKTFLETGESLNVALPEEAAAQ